MSRPEWRARHDAEQELGEREDGDRALLLLHRCVGQRHQPHIWELIVKTRSLRRC